MLFCFKSTVAFFFSGFTGAVINTDSQFVINCMTSWMSGWKKRGWKKSDGSPVINKDDLIDCDKASNGLRVKYVSNNNNLFRDYSTIKHIIQIEHTKFILK